MKKGGFASAIRPDQGSYSSRKKGGRDMFDYLKPVHGLAEFFDLKPFHP
jgi:hypothetical protein